jgi:AcrR family transcriptional regulator
LSGCAGGAFTCRSPLWPTIATILEGFQDDPATSGSHTSADVGLVVLSARLHLPCVLSGTLQWAGRITHPYPSFTGEFRVQTSLKERQWQLRQDVILDAAYELMAEGRGAGVSMDEVAALAGVSKPTLYQHFQSKDELLVHVSLRLMRQSEESLVARTPAVSALEQIECALREGLTRRAGLWSAQVVIPRGAAEASAAYREQRRRVQARMASLADEAKSAGDVDTSLATPVVVRMLSRLFRGDYEDLLTDGVVTPEELATTVIQVAFDGLRPRGGRQ